MKCYIENILTDSQVVSDVKTLIPDAGVRRRMSRLLKSAVSTAVETVGGPEGTDRPDAIVTATGLGFLADSERFLRNMIADDEQLLNPTPFIQSTFNTVGGQIALMRHNHCYNVTYVNRSRGFADALLDVLMRMADGESRTALLGVFDERTPAQQGILRRMGFRRKGEWPEGAVFALLTAEPSDRTIAELACLDFPAGPLTPEACLAAYAGSPDAVLLESGEDFGLFPLVPALAFADGVRKVAEGAREVIVHDGQRGGSPVIMVLRCIGR